MPTGDRLAAIFLLLFGVFVSLQSRGLAYWSANAPGPGFLPFWLGVLLAVSAAAIVVRTPAARESDGRRSTNAAATGGWRRVAALLGLTAAAAILGVLIGFVPASGLFVGITLTYLRPGHARANWTIASLAAVVVWLVFVRWLAVPLPAGRVGF